jgi:hypothetical protein
LSDSPEYLISNGLGICQGRFSLVPIESALASRFRTGIVLEDELRIRDEGFSRQVANFSCETSIGSIQP